MAGHFLIKKGVDALSIATAPCVDADDGYPQVISVFLPHRSGKRSAGRTVRAGVFTDPMSYDL